MRVMPVSKLGKIEFCEEHLARWQANAADIGADAAVMVDLRTGTAAARAAYLRQQELQNAARAATIEFNLAVADMEAVASGVLRQIRLKAATAGESVYALAAIPVPTAPSRLAPPGQPCDFYVRLDASGALELRWKCKNPAGSTGTIYQVWRKVDGTDGFTHLGATGVKCIIDDTLPAGSSQVTYQVQAARSTAVGPWATFIVNLGVSGGGAMMASLSEDMQTRIAA